MKRTRLVIGFALAVPLLAGAGCSDDEPKPVGAYPPPVLVDPNKPVRLVNPATGAGAQGLVSSDWYDLTDRGQVLRIDQLADGRTAYYVFERRPDGSLTPVGVHVRQEGTVQHREGIDAFELANTPDLPREAIPPPEDYTAASGYASQFGLTSN